MSTDPNPLPAPRPSLIGRMLRAALRTAVTLVVVGGAAFGVMAGQASLTSRLSADDGPAPAPHATVTVATIALQDSYETERRFAGQFEPRQEVAMGFEEGGTVAAILVSEGDHVEQGALLARLDIRLLQAERDRLAATRAALDAQTELARRTNARQAELRERGFATDQVVDDTSLTMTRLLAQGAEIDAAIAALDVRVSKAELRAPFAGRVGDRLLDLGAVAAPGAPLLTLLEDGAVRFRAGLDPALADTLAPGDPVDIEAGGRTLPALLDHLMPELDPATRARVAVFAVSGDAPPSRSAGELRMTRTVAAPMPGTWLPLSALRQGPRGSWQIVTVEPGPNGPVAGLEAVEILHAEGRDAFVAGTLRDGMTFVPEGVHRIVPGERLRLANPEAV